MRRPTKRCAFAGVIVALSSSPAAIGQQQFKLDDDDTWRQTQATDAGTPQGQLAQARAWLASGQFRRAENAAAQWIKRYESHAAIPDAYMIRGDALLAQGEDYKALFDYEFIARSFAGSEAFVTALQRELDIAKRYAAGQKRKLWGLRMVEADEEAEELFIRIQERMPGSRLAEEAGIELANFYFERRRMALAVDAYSLFIENYGDSELVPVARRRLIYAYLASFKGPQFDAAGLYEARARLHQLRAIEPAEAQRIGADALLTRIDESDAAKMVETARWYLRTGNPVAAELTIRRVIERYPRSVAAMAAIRLAEQVLPHLPSRVRAQAPDYERLSAEGVSH